MGLEDLLGFETAVQDRLDKVVDELSLEFAGIFDREQVRGIVDESARQLSGRNVSSFVPILAERFARERLRVQAQAKGLLRKAESEVLFVSLSGGGRAQIGAALLALRAGDSVSVHSAGSHAGGAIDPNVRTVLEEVGIDLSEAFTKPLTPEVLTGADLVVTMGRSVGLIEIPATIRHLDWRVGDPAGAPLEEVRLVRDDIARRIDLLAASLPASSDPVASGA
jgi:arsenate reductase (thioredoxin)